METLIIQIGTRHGRLAEIVECNGESILLGRSFVNDVVLSDPYVDPEQIKINKKDGKWLIQVLDDTNPVLLNGELVNEDGLEIKSGDRLTVGRTQLRVFSKDHKFESTRKLVFSSWFYQKKLGLLLPVLLVLLASVLSAFNEYMGLSKSVEYRPLISEVLVFAFFVFMWASLWALVGRLLRHQLHFSENLLFTAIIASIYVVVEPFGEYVEYLSGSLMLSAIFNSFVFLILMTQLLKFNLSLSSHIKNSGVVALCACSVILLLSYSVSEIKEDDFSAYAEYENKLKPPFAKLRVDMTTEEYLSDLEDQFFKAEEMLEED